MGRSVRHNVSEVPVSGFDPLKRIDQMASPCRLIFLS